MLIGALAGVAFCPPKATLSRRAAPRHHRPAACADASAPEDWRDVRAKLVAQERAAQQQGEGADGEFSGTAGYVYESPLIEQGSVILGGTRQEFGREFG